MIDNKNSVENLRFIETNLQLIVDAIEKYKRNQMNLSYLINYLERIINELKVKDDNLANILHDIWLDPYVVNKMYVMRQRPELEDEEFERINSSLEEMLKFIKDLPIYKN